MLYCWPQARLSPFLTPSEPLCGIVLIILHLSFLRSHPTKLEVDPSVLKEVDFGNIVHEKPKNVHREAKTEKSPAAKDSQFVDDPNVPPLI